MLLTGILKEVIETVFPNSDAHSRNETVTSECIYSKTHTFIPMHSNLSAFIPKHVCTCTHSQTHTV